MRAALVLLVVFAALPLVETGATATRAGLRGVVMLSPAAPVCLQGRPCEKPAVGVLLQFRRNGRVAAQVTTGRGGWYAVRLAPGRYAVRAPKYRVGTGLSPQRVTVLEGRVIRRDFRLDSGMQ